MDKAKILEFLQKNDLCVMATSNKECKPEAAVMACVVKDDFTVLMSTEAATRKVANLRDNNKVAITVGGCQNDPCVQLDGEVTIYEGEAAQQAKAEMLAKHPDWEHYFDSPSSLFLGFRPAWLRFSDFSQATPEFSEISF